MADPIKKNAQDYARRDANNESGEYHHTCSFGLFQKDFRRSVGQSKNATNSVSALSPPLGSPFRSSHRVKSRTCTACLIGKLVTGIRTVASPSGIPATHS